MSAPSAGERSQTLRQVSIPKKLPRTGPHDSAFPAHYPSCYTGAQAAFSHRNTKVVMSVSPIAELEQELSVLADKLLSEQPVIGAKPLSPNEKMALAVRALVDRLCPHKARINSVIHTLGFQASVTLVDVVICMTFRLDVPMLKVSEILCRIGLETFCQDPPSLLST